MNLTVARVVLNSSIKIHTTRCPLTGQLYLLSCSNHYRKSICRTNIMKHNSSKIYRNNYNFRNDTEDGPIGIYGYSLLAVPILSFILGVWQIERRKWKLKLIEDLRQRIDSEPIELPENLEELTEKEYCPVKARGRFLYDKEFTIGPKSLIIRGAGASETGSGIFGSRSSTGYYVITPFKLEDRDVTILVNRGWVPPAYKYPEKKRSAQIDGVVEIKGIIRSHESRPNFVAANLPQKGVWLYRDVSAMAEVAGTDPIFIDLMLENHPPGAPISCQTRVTLRNEHLSYIITWFSLSGITGWMWFRMFIQKLPLV